MTVTRRNLADLPRLVDLAARVGADEVYLQRLVYFGALLARREESLHGRLSAAHRAIIAEAEARAAASGIALRACGHHSPLAMLEAPADPEVWRTCRRPWDGSVVMANGDVVPCCISTFTAPRRDIVMGNVLASSWDEVWNGPAYADQRRRMTEGEPPPHCARCGGCWSL
jgi:MoaA/NifB/PqqE/SkfB family radical SAM enzyme